MMMMALTSNSHPISLGALWAGSHLQLKRRGGEAFVFVVKTHSSLITFEFVVITPGTHVLPPMGLERKIGKQLSWSVWIFFWGGSSHIRFSQVVATRTALSQAEEQTMERNAGQPVTLQCQVAFSLFLFLLFSSSRFLFIRRWPLLWQESGKKTERRRWQHHYHHCHRHCHNH